MNRKAFTIVELVVVIAIMILLLGIAMPAIKSMTRSNNQKQAANLLTTLIANARSTALQTHTPAGLVIYEDPAIPDQSSVQLVVQSSESDLKYFRAAPRTGAQTIPKGIKIATLDSNAISFRTDSSTPDTKCRIILFNGDGQLVLWNKIARDPSLTDAASAAWNLNATVANPSSGVSTPAVVIYNSNEMQAAVDKGTITDATTRAAWLKTNADVLIVNAYTGNIIR